MRCLDAAASDVPASRARRSVGARRAARSALERAIDVELAAADQAVGARGDRHRRRRLSSFGIGGHASSPAAAGLSEADEEVRAAAREHAVRPRRTRGTFAPS